MILKCPDCGIEYSYGRSICHICGDTKIFFGAMFKAKRTDYKWNCATSFESVGLSIDGPDFRDSLIEIYPEG